MSGSKVKNIVIILLVLINIFFLSIIISNKVNDSVNKHRMRENLFKVLSQNGIQIDMEQIDNEDQLDTYSVGRDPDPEHRLAEVVLGDVETEYKGGNIYEYTGSGGTAVFRQNGEFEITLEGTSPLDTGEPEETAKNILNRAEITGESSFIEDRQIVLTQCDFAGKPIFNCKIMFEFDSRGLKRISGRRLTDDPVYAESGNTISAYSAVLKVLDRVKGDEGSSCSMIKSVRIGYTMSSSVLGDATLAPSWMVETDSDCYYVDALTGSITSESKP